MTMQSTLRDAYRGLHRPLKAPFRSILKEVNPKLFLPLPINNPTEISPGTEIRAKRFHGYAHHGVVVARNLVVHRIRGQKSYEGCSTCAEAKAAADWMGHRKWSELKPGDGLALTCVACFKQGDKVVEVPYGSDEQVIAFIRSYIHRGAKSYVRNKAPVEEIIQRAYNVLMRKDELVRTDCWTTIVILLPIIS